MHYKDRARPLNVVTPLARLCLARETTVATAAENLGVSVGYLYAVGSGIHAASERVATGLADFLGVSVEEVRAACPGQGGRRPHTPCDEAVVALRAAGISRNEIARRMGVAAPTVYAKLDGRRPVSEALMAAVEDATGLPREAVFPRTKTAGEPDG